MVDMPTLDALIDVYARWLDAPEQAQIREIEGDADELMLHVCEMCLDTPEGAAERALRGGATQDQAEIWRAWILRFIELWEVTE